MSVKESVKHTTPAPPKPAAAPEAPPAPPTIGLLFIAAGVLLMILSVWTQAPSPLGAWENASSTNPSQSPSVVAGSAGDDDLYGEAGGEFIAGREGDDFIEAKDGARDHISCGPGDDAVSVDGGLDVVAEDCETVYGVGVVKR